MRITIRWSRTGGSGPACIDRGAARTRPGPDGDRIITHEQGSVRYGTEDTNVNGTIRNEHE
jgi:hypothetical protein